MFTNVDNSVWNAEVKVIDFILNKPTIYIPYEILQIFKKIHSEYPQLEVGAYVKGKIDENYNVYVQKDVYIPEQEVTGGSIEFKEPPPEGFNGVIHKHPIGVTQFSTTDYEYINKNFNFSILYEDTKGFCDAVIKIHTNNPNVVLIVPARIEVISNVNFEIPKHKIKEKILRQYKYNNNVSNYDYNYGYNDISIDTQTFVDLMNKYNLKKLDDNTWFKREIDYNMNKFDIYITKNNTDNTYTIRVIDPDANLEFENITTDSIYKIEDILLMYTDPLY